MFEIDDELSAQLLSIQEEQAGRMFMSKRTATFPEHSPFINGPLMMSNREYAMPTMSSGRTPSTVSSQTGRIQDLRKSLLASNTFIVMNIICRRR